MGKRVLEVGSQDVNGSVRSLIQHERPASYLGVDIGPGPGVDEICDASRLMQRYGPRRFDLVISTEMLEHVQDWRRVVTNLKGVLRPGGVLLVTTRSFGFPYHGYPHDYWRYELDDLRAIFADLAIERLDADPLEPGVFLKARKRDLVQPTNLDAIALYSMLAKRRLRKLGRWRLLAARWKQSAPSRKAGWSAVRRAVGEQPGRFALVARRAAHRLPGPVKHLIRSILLRTPPPRP